MAENSGETSYIQLTASIVSAYVSNNTVASADIPNLVTVNSSDPDVPIDLMVKAHGQTLYIFAAISGAGTANGEFLVQGMNGYGPVTVLGENRTFTVTDGQFGDVFAANDVHIYEIDLTAVTCD